VMLMVAARVSPMIHRHIGLASGPEISVANPAHKALQVTLPGARANDPRRSVVSG